MSVNRTYEPLTTKLIIDSIAPGGTIIDVGANIGYYTLVAARSAGPRGKVFAFEPDPTNFELLKRNVSANAYTTVVTVNKAVSNRTGTAALYLDEFNRGDHRMYDSHDGRSYVRVDAVRLDDFFRPSSPKVDVVKIDIQGAEAWAVEGMSDLLKTTGDVVLFTEFWPQGLHRCGVEAEDYLQSLAALGFERFYDIDERRESVTKADPTTLVKRYSVMEGNYANLLCLKHGSRHQVHLP